MARHRHDLATRLGKDPALSNIAVLSVDPGAMASDLTRRGSFAMRIITAKILLLPVAAISTWYNPNGTFRTTTKSAADVISACFDVKAPPAGRFLYLNGSEEFETSEKVKRTMVLERKCGSMASRWPRLGQRILCSRIGSDWGRCEFKRAQGTVYFNLLYELCIIAA